MDSSRSSVSNRSRGRGRRKRRDDRVKEAGSNRYQLAPSNRDKPTNIPEIEKLIKLKKSMTTSVLGDVSAMSDLQRKLTDSRRIRKQKMRGYDDDDTSSQCSSRSSRSGRSTNSSYRPEWSVTNTTEAKLTVKGENRCPSPYHDPRGPTPTRKKEKLRKKKEWSASSNLVSMAGGQTSQGEWSSRHQADILARVELQRQWAQEKSRIKQSYSQPQAVYEVRHTPTVNKVQGQIIKQRQLDQIQYEKEEAEYKEQQIAEGEMNAKLKAVQLPDMPDPEYEQLQKTRKQVANVENFIATLPALGTW